MQTESTYNIKICWNYALHKSIFIHGTIFLLRIECILRKQIQFKFGLYPFAY